MELEPQNHLSTRAASAVIRAYLMHEGLLPQGLIHVHVSGADEARALLGVVGLGDPLQPKEPRQKSDLDAVGHVIFSYDDLIAGKVDAGVQIDNADFRNSNDSIFRRAGKTAYVIEIDPLLDHFPKQKWYKDIHAKIAGIVRSDLAAISVAVIEDDISQDPYPVRLRIETPNASGRVYPKNDRAALENFLKPLSDWVHKLTGTGFCFRVGQTSFLQADVSSGTAVANRQAGSQFTLTYPLRSNFDGQGRKTFRGKGFLTIAHAFRHVLEDAELIVFVPAKPAGQRARAGAVQDHEFSFQSTPKRADRVDAAVTSMEDNCALVDLADIKLTSIRRPVAADRARTVIILTSVKGFQSAELYELQVSDGQFVDDDFFKPRYAGLFTLRSQSQNSKGLRVPLTSKGDSGSLVCVSMGNGEYAAIGMVIAGGRRQAEERYPLTYALPLPEAFAALGLAEYIDAPEAHHA